MLIVYCGLITPGPVIIYSHGTVVLWPGDAHIHTQVRRIKETGLKMNGRQSLNVFARTQFYGRNFKLVGKRFIKSLTYFHFQIIAEVCMSSILL